MIDRQGISAGALSLLFFWGAAQTTNAQHLNLEPLANSTPLRVAARGELGDTFDRVAASELDGRSRVAGETIHIPTRDVAPPVSRVSTEEAKKHEFMANLLVLSALAMTFGIGLVMTIVTIRRQSQPRAPHQIF